MKKLLTSILFLCMLGCTNYNYKYLEPPVKRIMYFDANYDLNKRIINCNNFIYAGRILAASFKRDFAVFIVYKDEEVKHYYVDMVDAYFYIDGQNTSIGDKELYVAQGCNFKHILILRKKLDKYRSCNCSY